MNVRSTCHAEASEAGSILERNIKKFAPGARTVSEPGADRAAPGENY